MADAGRRGRGSRVPRRLRSRAAGLAVALLTAGGAGACGVVHLGDGERCLPSPLTASPQRVAAGATVRISSPPFACTASYPRGARYRLTLGFAGRAAPAPLGSAPVAPDGSFTATVAVPADAPPGDAYLDVRGSAFDDCTDTEGGSCAGYGVPLTLLPPP